MTQHLEVYKCELCGNIVEMLHASDGTLVCCDQPMTLMTENTVDAAKEKHVPVIEKTDKGVKVKIGDVPHPMEEKHYIEWIEVIVDGKSYIQFLNPGDAPEAFFEIAADQITAREFCNIHGHWKNSQ
jgi:superoxide reductase